LKVVRAAAAVWGTLTVAVLRHCDEFLCVEGKGYGLGLIVALCTILGVKLEWCCGCLVVPVVMSS